MTEVSGRILIVEDSVAARNLAVRMLTSLGYVVSAAKDASEALTILDQEPKFDVLFTDIIMPGENDGVSLARIVRARCPTIKILFTSGFSSMNPDELKIIDAVYVAKPYRKAEIAFLLRSILKASV